MPTLLDAADREVILRRLAVTETSPRQWGRLSVGGMLCHLHESARMALGELPVRPKGKRAFQVFPLKHLLLYVVPFPRGAPTAPATGSEERARRAEAQRQAAGLPGAAPVVDRLKGGLGWLKWVPAVSLARHLERPRFSTARSPFHSGRAGR